MPYLNLDMDGPLADFVKGTKELTGKRPDEWDKVSKSALWDAFEDIATQKPYMCLPVAEGAAYLLRSASKWARENDYDLRILTAVPLWRPDEVAEHKSVWFSAKFPYYDDLPIKVCYTSENKFKECSPGDILIDDYHKNIKSWKAAGGVGIHYNLDTPQPAQSAVRELFALR